MYPFINLPTYLSSSVSVYLLFFQSTHLSNSVSFYHQSICCLSLYPFVYLSIHLSLLHTSARHPKCCACHESQRASRKHRASHKIIQSAASAATKPAHDSPKHCACHPNQRSGVTSSQVLRLPRNSSQRSERCACACREICAPRNL